MRISERNRFQAIADSHLALCASGTATLEVGLLGTPMLVLYRLASWTYLLARCWCSLPYVSLVNLVLEQEAVPELLQGQAKPERIAREAFALLGDRDRVAAMRGDLARLRARLGERGASARAAAEVAARLAPAACDALPARGRAGEPAAVLPPLLPALRRLWGVLAGVGIVLYAAATTSLVVLIEPIFGEVLLAGDQVPGGLGVVAGAVGGHHAAADATPASGGAEDRRGRRGDRSGGRRTRRSRRPPAGCSRSSTSRTISTPPTWP